MHITSDELYAFASFVVALIGLVYMICQNKNKKK